jgi:glycosyltransferase involved in cell wall biosynthesis
VYEPYLRDHQINVFIAGCIDISQFNHPNDKFFSIGPVLDLKPLYRKAKVVILPVTRGTGTAIKTLEAIHFGKAVVGTRPAFRGLGDLDCSDLIAANAFAFAEKTKTLLFDTAFRKKTEETILAMQKKLCNSERYDRALGSLINELEAA